MKKKICFAVQRYGLEVNGGAELLIRELAERMACSFDVTVLTTKAVDYLSWNDHYRRDEEQLNGVRVLRFSVDFPREMEVFNEINGRFLRGELPPGEEARWIWEQGPVALELERYVREHQEEYQVFLFGPYLYWHTVTCLPQVAHKAVLIPMAHDEPFIHMGIFRQVFERAAAVCYLTPEEREFVQGLFPGVTRRDMIGGAGVEVPEEVSAERFRARYGLDGDYVVYVGRIDEGKNCDELFRYWEAYRSTHTRPLTLVLMGKPVIPIPQRDDVRSLGFVSEQDKFDGMRGAQALVLPSRFESLSIVVLEAMSLGVPVLVNGGCAVLRGHCRKSNAGLYYETFPEFCAALDFLRSGNGAVQAMRENGPAYVNAYYQWPVILENLTRLIDEIGSGR